MNILTWIFGYFESLTDVCRLQSWLYRRMQSEGIPECLRIWHILTRRPHKNGKLRFEVKLRRLSTVQWLVSSHYCYSSSLSTHALYRSRPEKVAYSVVCYQGDGACALRPWEAHEGARAVKWAHHVRSQNPQKRKLFETVFHFNKSIFNLLFNRFVFIITTMYIKDT